MQSDAGNFTHMIFFHSFVARNFEYPCDNRLYWDGDDIIDTGIAMIYVVHIGIVMMYVVDVGIVMINGGAIAQSDNGSETCIGRMVEW